MVESHLHAVLADARYLASLHLLASRHHQILELAAREMLAACGYFHDFLADGAV